MVIATDLVGIVELWSGGAEQLYGWSADGAIGRPLHQLVRPMDRHGQAHDFIAGLAATGAWEGELTVARAGGSTLPVHVRTAHVHDDAGEATDMVSVSLDLSLRVAMQEQLARSNRELTAITDSIGDGLCVLDVDGCITSINLSARSLDDPTLPHLIEQLLQEAGAETALLNSVINASRFAVRIHELGCRLALDVLKIDIEFVRDATTNPASRHVIDAVGEGVEDQATLEVLKDLNVDYVQGFFLRRP